LGAPGGSCHSGPTGMMQAEMDEAAANDNSNFRALPSSNRATGERRGRRAPAAVRRRANPTLRSGAVGIFPGCRTTAFCSGLGAASVRVAGARRRPVVLAALALLEVAEDGARVDAQIARGLGPVAVVQRQDLVDVVALELLLGLRQRQDGWQIVGRQV